MRPLALLPEPGRNWGLGETIRDALDHEERVSLWGPYRIEPELYRLALERKAELDSGCVEFKSIDSGWPTDRASNCIHAVADVVGGSRVRIASPGWGETASYAVLMRMRPWIVSRTELYPWVSSRLGLDQYPLIYRDFEALRSGAIRGPISYFLASAVTPLPATARRVEPTDRHVNNVRLRRTAAIDSNFAREVAGDAPFWRRGPPPTPAHRTAGR